MLSTTNDRTVYKVLPNDLTLEKSNERLKLEEELGALHEQYGQLESSIVDAQKNRQFSSVRTLLASRKQISNKIAENANKISML